MKNSIKQLLLIIFSTLILFSNANTAEYPSTSIAVIDLNLILNESKAAINANEQIEEISVKINNEISQGEKSILDEQKMLIEAQSIMAPEAFEEKRISYEKSVQDFQIKSQNTLIKLDNLIATIRVKILDEIAPILEEIAEEKGITVVLEKGTVILNADNMDITNIVIKQLNKNLPKIKVEFEE